MAHVPLSLCMIVKDEIDQLKRCLESVKSYVDEINILVTSSNKATWDICEEYGARVDYFDWCHDFSAARTASFAMSSNDIILWLDADDVLLNGDCARRCVDIFFDSNRNSLIMLQYNYEYDENGLLVAQHWRERIVNRTTVRWEGRIHETFIPIRPLHVIKYEEAAVDHLHTREDVRKKHERNIEILLKAHEDNPEDARTMYYIGCTLLGLDDYKQAIEWLKEYVKISGWDEEKYIACVRCSDAYLTLNDPDSAKAWAFKALSIKPTYPDAYFKLAQISYRAKDYKSCLHWIETLFRLPKEDTEVIRNPQNYTYNPMLLMSECLFNLDRFDEALAALFKLKEATPGNKQIDYKISLCSRAKRIAQAERNYVDLVEYCIQNEELGKAEKIAELMPNDVRHLPKAVQQRARAQKIMNRIRNYDRGIRENPLGMTFHAFPDIETEKKYRALLVYLSQRPEITSVLDVGCFNGWMANDLALRGWTVKGIDIGKEGLDVAKEVAEKKSTGAKFEQCKYKDIGSKFHRQYDAVTCFDVLEHVLDPRDLIKQLELACKVDGWIFLNVPNGAWHKGEMDTTNVEYYEHIASYEYVDIVRLFNGRKNLTIIPWESEHERAILSPGQGGLFIAYQNRAREGRDIAIFCGATSEQWSPRNEKLGIGGSEEAVINVSREFVKLGANVTVYCNCGNQAGIYDDVAYVHYEEFDTFAEYDVLIGWRNPHFFTLPLKANKKILWLHDVPNPEHFSDEVLRNVDKIFVLSMWHRECLPDVPDDKFYITKNGVNLSYFDKYRDEKKNPHQLIYTSSPDRGLDVLLGMWKDIRSEIPDAELHVFYGWTVFDALRTKPTEIAWRRKVQELMNQDGVVNHGRVGHEEIAQEMRKSGVWAYPTYFTEISCISAMKAQIAGCIPVCTDFAALAETVQYGEKIHGSIYDGDNITQFKNKLIEVLKRPRDEKYITEMQEWACTQYDWKNIANDWLTLFSTTRRK